MPNEVYESGPERLFVMEPGEVHVTTALKGLAAFFVVMLKRRVARVADDLGTAGAPHWTRLGVVAARSGGGSIVSSAPLKHERAAVL